jgi:hypothetical protein
VTQHWKKVGQRRSANARMAVKIEEARRLALGCCCESSFRIIAVETSKCCSQSSIRIRVRGITKAMSRFKDIVTHLFSTSVHVGIWRDDKRAVTDSDRRLYEPWYSYQNLQRTMAVRRRMGSAHSIFETASVDVEQLWVLELLR